jgi:hypothetical protein
MIELFRSIPEMSTGTLHHPQWPYIQRGLRRNVEKVTLYNQTYNKPVISNHLLIRLLNSMGTPMSLNLERYYANVDAKAMTLSKAMQLTSSIDRGRVFKGIFYGASNPEIIIANDDFFDFQHVHDNWRDVSAVTPLLHPKSDLGLHLPNGKDYSDETGLAIIMVNIPMLCVQYRAFSLEQMAKQDDVSKTIAQFIGGFVLPNMLKAQTEICLFNRIYNLKFGLDNGKREINRKHPFVMPVYDQFVDYSYMHALDNVSKSPLNFMTIMKTIPALYNKNLYETLLMPDIAPTNQIDWVLVLARLKAIDFLFRISGDWLLAKNQMQVNQVLRAFKHNNVLNSINERLPVSELGQVKNYIQTILEGAEREFFN